MSETTGPFDSDNEHDLSIQVPEASLERGQVIDHYRLIHRLGRGGQGEVWLAEQNEPVRRQVAIKFLRTHNLKRDTRIRFEMERQALAMMDHPHIAKIFDMASTSAWGPTSRWSTARVNLSPPSAMKDDCRLVVDWNYSFKSARLYTTRIRRV